VLLEPIGEAALEPGAAVAELGQLDQILELEVVDVVDQPSNLLSGGYGSQAVAATGRERTSLRATSAPPTAAAA
jgi:hypothetical protein